MIINEGGINWAWFTELTVNKDDTVTINRYYRLHLSDIAQWPQENRDALSHPMYYHEQIWKEDKDRVAVAYNVPEHGWLKIANPRYIFDYEQ